MIKISADFNMADIEAYIREEEEAWYDEIVASMLKVMKKLVDKARAKTKTEGGFGNITWNLRASIGGCIVNQTGKIVETYFPPIAKGAHGNKIGREFAERIALYSRDNNEISMVFVAGEDYAVFVQSEQASGRDVIKHVIGNNIDPEMIKELGI
jgi:hypothetical protein